MLLHGETGKDREKEKRLSVLACWWYPVCELLVEIGRQRHDLHANEEACMKEITISCAFYQEKLYANGDISSSDWISERSAALQIHCG